MAWVRTKPESPPAPPLTLGRRLFFACVGMIGGLIMGFLAWLFCLFTHEHHPVALITLSLMVLEGLIGFLVANGDKGKLDDLVSFIVAFFILP